MTANLEGALEPGEQIVFRAKGRSYRSLTIMHSLGQVSAYAGFVILVTILDPSIGFALLLLFGGIGVIELAILWAFIVSQRRNPDDLAITDRRLLFADSYWDDKLEKMPLAEIKHIRWSSNGQIRCLSLRGEEDEMVLPQQRGDERIAKEIAAATGLAAPPRLGSFLAVDPVQIAQIPFFFAGFAGAILFFGGLPKFTGDVAYWIQLSLLSGMTVSVVLAGTLIGLILVFGLIRLILPAERMRLFLCAGRKDRWPTRLALNFFAILYGRPMPYITF